MGRTIKEQIIDIRLGRETIGDPLGDPIFIPEEQPATPDPDREPVPA